MAKLTSLLQQRFKKKETPKMSELAEKASEGQLTVFAGMFGVAKNNDKEKELLSDLLNKYASETPSDFSRDLDSLLTLTSEVKAINNQAALLHGERIKKAQGILKSYREGAFTAWLQATYGNRQTPYNFLQYYEFYTHMPPSLRPQIEAMPRQAVYTLASREGLLEKKEEIVRNYQGEGKQQMITLIRSLFPLKESDERRENMGESSIKLLQRVAMTLSQLKPSLTVNQKRVLLSLLNQIKSHLE